jgi:hypothetical protein
VYRLSPLNQALLLAVGYGVCVNVSLLLQRRYEAGVFFLLGAAHVLSRLRFWDGFSASFASALRRSALLVLAVAILLLALGRS